MRRLCYQYLYHLSLAFVGAWHIPLSLNQAKCNCYKRTKRDTLTHTYTWIDRINIYAYICSILLFCSFTFSFSFFVSYKQHQHDHQITCYSLLVTLFFNCYLLLLTVTFLLFRLLSAGISGGNWVPELPRHHIQKNCVFCFFCFSSF